MPHVYSLLRALAHPTLAVLLLLAAPLALADTIAVTTEADDDSDGQCSFTEALQAANTDSAIGGCAAGDGDDTIVFADGLDRIDLPTADRVVSQNLTIDGDSRITLDPEGSRVLRVGSGATLTIRDITLSGGIAPQGGLIHVGDGAALIAEGLTAQGSEATGDAADMGGGAISVDGGEATISGSTFTNNRASGTSGSGGAIINKGGTLTVTNSAFSDNTSNRAGGAIEDASGTTNLTGVTLSGNNAGTNPGNGGGLHTGGGTVTVSGGSVTNNTAVEGGGLWSSGTLTVSDETTISGNTAIGDDDDAFEGGGGLFNQGGTMTVTGATVSNNAASGPGGSGGGAFNSGDGELTIRSSTFTSNTSNRAGGGIEVNGGTVTLEDVDFASNNAGTSPGNGGALHVTTGTVNATSGEVTGNMAVEGGGFWNNAGSTMTLTGVSLSGNRAMGTDADNGGGGLYNNGGTLNLNSVTLAENTATEGSGSGGGLLSTAGTVTVTGSSFSENDANRAGGAIEIVEGMLMLTDTDFTGNATGDAPGNGGALHVTGAARVTVTGGTVSGNTAASEGGGFWNQTAARMTVTGTVFTDNVAEGDAADGGGGALYNNGGTLRLMQARIVRNSATGDAGSGGGILNNGGTLHMSGGIVDTNRANRAGGGIEDASGTVQLDSVLVRGNLIADAAPGNGGGLHSGGGTVTVTNSSFLGNTAVEGGGLWASGTLSIVSTEGGDMFVMDNVATGDDADNGGGGVFQQAGTVTIRDAMITGNRATGTSGSGGGVFLSDGATAEVTGGSISGNTSSRAGGGLEIADDPETETLAAALIFDTDISGNNAGTNPGNGGGIHSGGGDLVIQFVRITGNTAVEGGGIWSNGSVTTGGVVVPVAEDGMAVVPTRNTVSGNTATGNEPSNGGGGIFAQTGGTFVLSDMNILNNRATGTSGSGGGIFVLDGSSVTVERSRITGNQANRAGGGIEVADDASTDAPTTFTLRTTEVSANSIETANPGNGGGLHVGGAGSADVSTSTFAENTAAEGAGLWISGGGMLMLTHSTVSANTATGDGGGVYDNGPGGAIALSSVTLAFNEAGAAGGGFFTQDNSGGDTFTLSNTIVSGNRAPSGSNCAGPSSANIGLVRFAGRNVYSAESSDACILVGEVDGLVAGDPLLASLADNGGPTRTHALRAGSPAIDAGTTDADTDQRGFARDTMPDIGAFERGAASPVCAPDAPLAFGDLDVDDDPTVTIRATEGMPVLDGCTFAVYESSDRTLSFAQLLSGTLNRGDAITLTEGNGDGDLPDALLDDTGALLLFSGTVAQGDTLSRADLMRVVAAVVYEDGMTTLFVSGGATADEQSALADALERVFTSIDEAATFALELTAQPNPARGAVRVGFGVAQSADVRVAVYDLLGRTVATLADQAFAAGRHHVDLDAGRLAAGLYVVRIQTGERTETTRLTIVR
jgi:hypothetical protein